MLLGSDGAGDPPRGLRAAWREHRWQVLALFALVAASLAYRVYVAQECSLWYDEATTVYDIDAPLPKLLRGPSREHPPLMFWLVRLATAVLGRSDLALRAISLFFGCVLLVAVYLLCLELRLGATRALVPVASLALTPFFIRHATEARQYAMMAAFTTLATVFALRLLRGPLRLSELAGFAACTVGASATHFFALPYAGALWAAVAAGTFRTWNLRALAPPHQRALLVIVGVSGLLLLALSADLLLGVRYYEHHSLGGHATHHLRASAVWRSFSFFARPAWNPADEAVLAVAGLVILALRLGGLAGLVPLGMALPPVFAATLLSSGHMLTPRYLWPSFVFYQLGEVTVALACVRLVEWCVARAGSLARPLSVAAWLMLLVPLGARIGEFPTGFGAGGAVNYRGLAQYFRGPRAHDTALVVFVGYAGLKLMGTAYRVPHVLTLDAFEPIPGIDRYLVAEFGSSDHRYEAKFAPLLADKLGLSRRQWRALKPLKLAGDRFQRPAPARLVILDRAARQDDGAPPVTQQPAQKPDSGVNDDDGAPLDDAPGNE